MAIRITVAEPITVQAVASICGSYVCSRSLSRLGPFALPRAAGRRSPRLRERRPGEPSPGMPAAGVTPDWVDAAWRPCGGFRPGAPALRKQPVGSASMARRWTPSEDVALRLAAALDWEHGGRRRGLVPRGRHHFLNEKRTNNEERSTQRNRPLNRIMTRRSSSPQIAYSRLAVEEPGRKSEQQHVMPAGGADWLKMQHFNLLGV